MLLWAANHFTGAQLSKYEQMIGLCKQIVAWPSSSGLCLVHADTKFRRGSNSVVRGGKNEEKGTFGPS